MPQGIRSDENGQRIPDGKGGWKNHREDTTDWNDKGNVEIWRAAWAAYTNRALESAGRSGRIDHRSYKRQGIDKIPSVHLGPAASQMEKRGIRTDKGEVNRQIAADNKLLKEIKARITRLYRWSKDEAEKTTNTAKQLDSFVGGSAAVERSPHPHRQNPGFAGKRCTIQLCRQTASSLCSSFMKKSLI